MSKQNSKVRFIDLFSGLGGTRIGFEQAVKSLGLIPECVFTSDKKAAAVKAYKNNFGDSRVMGDITGIKVNDIPDFDYLLGGFPCQPFSKAGSQKGFSDTRGTLFFNILQIIERKTPNGFLLENVDRLVNHDNGNTLKVIIESLMGLGYSVSWKVFNSADFGLVQSRKRFYIIGHRNKNVDLNNIVLEKLPYKKKVFSDIQEHNQPCVNNSFTNALLSCFTIEQLYGKQIIDKRGGKNVIHSWDFNALGETTKKQRELLCKLAKHYRQKKFAIELGIKWRDGMPLNINQIKSFINYDDLSNDLEYLVDCGYLIKKHPYCDGTFEQRYDLPIGYRILTGRLLFYFNRILSPDGQCITLTATDASKIGVIDNKIRDVTRREMLRLFGFPESYSLDCVSINEAYDLCGNSICVPIIKEISIILVKD